MMTGFLVIDKPVGVTSHDVVGMMRSVLREKRIGHSGTLDPFATGVLVLGVGRATRLMQYLDEAVKVYVADVALGARTDTGDLTGAVVATGSADLPSRERIELALASMLGPQLQMPPRYAAIKVDGRPLYAYARAGEEVEVQPRPITLHKLELLKAEPGLLQIRITCSRGTYARVVGEDLATRLGTEGHLCALRREQSGVFTIDEALTADTISDVVATEPGLGWERVLGGRRGDRAPRRSTEEIHAALAPSFVSPLDALRHLPMVELHDDLRARVVHGQVPRGLDLPMGRARLAQGTELVAVVERDERGARLLLVHAAQDADERDEKR